MAYDETPKKPIEKRDGSDSGYADHDEDITKAGDAGSYCDRTDAGSQGVGYLGIDDIDRIRRKNLKHKTR
jgi:hypothetical protein